MQPPIYNSDRSWKLPPLILHPFADLRGPGKLIDSSRASLVLQGFLPNEEAFTQEQLKSTLLDGRMCEIRMLYYVGKDVNRWLDQCQEFVERQPELKGSGLDQQSFAALLIESPPQPVRDKLSKWGVLDFKAIFSRAIGLNRVFADVPPMELLSPEFIRDYYRYADQLFACSQSLNAFARIEPGTFDFELYASGEYSRMLERQWQEI